MRILIQDVMVQSMLAGCPAKSNQHLPDDEDHRFTRVCNFTFARTDKTGKNPAVHHEKNSMTQCQKMLCWVRIS